MNIQAATFALLLSAAVPCQTRQFQADQHRAPTLLLSGPSTTLACGDVDGDGSLDILRSRFDSWLRTTDLLLSRRVAGAWQQSILGSVPSTGGQIPRIDALLADLDGDGDADIVAVVTGESTAASARIVYFRNDGGGAFSLPANTPLPGVREVQVAVGDVDGDGDRDVVLGLRDGSGQALPLALYLHDGAFGFQLAANALPATPASAPDLCDLDGDGDLDVVAVAGTGVVLAFANQAGTFAGGPVAAGPARHVRGADLDGDGDGDVLVQGPDGSVQLLRNTGSGFQLQPVAAGGGGAGSRPVLGDVDRDLDLDLVVQVGGELRVLRNDAGGFTVEVVAGAGAFAVGDEDRDGGADLVFDAAGAGVAVALGRPGRMLLDPALLRRPFVANANRGFTEDAADLDQDGRVDIVQQDYYQVLVRRNRGAGAWSTVVLEVPFLRPRVRAVDVDGDGDHDLVVVNGDPAGGLQVFRHEVGFAFTALPTQPLPQAGFAGKGDFDGDGRGDLLIQTGAGLQWLRSSGGAFASPVTVFAGSIGWTDPGIWDWDGDGDLDLIVVPNYSSCAQLFVNDGSGSFSLGNPCAIQAPLGWGSLNSMALVDIDGDGDPDAFTWGYGSGRMLINLGGTFVQSQALNGVFGSALLKPIFADWDSDGDIDMLQLGGPAQFWRNPGNGILVDETAARIGWSEFSGAGAADLDGDGDPDVVGVFGMLSSHVMNQLRAATTLSAPVPGGQLRVRFAHEPGFAAAGTPCVPMLALLPRSAPLPIGGIAGEWQLDINTTVTLPLLVLPAPAGTAESVVAVPAWPGLIGLDLYAQGLLLGGAPGFTPVVHERILP